MQFKIAKHEILVPLQHISRIATSKVIPILSGVLVIVNPDRMILVGGDSNNILRYELSNDKFEYAESGSIVLPIAKLYEMIKKMDGDWIRIERMANHSVHIVCGNSNFRLVGMDADEYPDVRMEQSGQQMMINGEKLKELISQTMYAISSREETPLLTGIHIQLHHNQVQFTACDRHRVARMTECLECEISEEKVIAGKTLAEIKNIVKDGDPVLIDILDHRVIFKQGAFTYAVTPLEGRYPNIEKMIRMESGSRAVVSTKNFLRTLERTLIISDRGNGYITTMRKSDDHLKIFCQSENGYLDEMITLELHDGDNYEINYNIKYAIDALKAIRTEYTAIHYSHNQKLIVFKADEQESSVHLIMGALK